jgi:hypothetical protein
LTPDCADTTGASVLDGPGGHNLIGNGSGCQQLRDGVGGDRVGSASALLDPHLAPLAYDGGATETEPLLAGSPAIGAGSAATCELPAIRETDERGDARKATRRVVCDIGAYDTAGARPKTRAVTLSSPAAASATVGSPFLVALKAKGTPTPAFSVSGALPPGVTLTDNGDGTAQLSGVPSSGAAGTYAIAIVASNGASPDSSHPLTLTVENLSVAGVSPAQVLPGRKTTVTLVGTGFEPGATITASNPAIAFSAVKVKSSTVITAKETVGGEAESGSYDLSVGAPGATATCAGCLGVALPEQ